MPFVDFDKMKADAVPSVQTPIKWELKDKTLSGILVVRGDGGLHVEVSGSTENPGEIGREMAKKLAVTLLRNQGFEVTLERGQKK